jgi:hypothetical protein
MTNENGQRADAERPSVNYIGSAVDFPCPCCGERLWVFVPAEGEIRVVARKDIPPESDAGE